MYYEIDFIPISKLFPHEEVNMDSVRDLVYFLQNTITDDIFPIIIDQETKVIIDGHHRYRAFEILKKTKIPAIFIDYFDSDIVVCSFQKLRKEQIIKAAFENQLFVPKTSCHMVKKEDNFIPIKTYFEMVLENNKNQKN